ncbi:uncharacterized protein LOC109364219 [Meleagris gallopavo]|uniref:uncharacterized protein LOC109364219 n=1 Tax=Meleagris gallopavo TaxID=9103 RepID=UPI00093EA9AB|nr:uncharacterized protein LOC109364219 [Meleagris gallopavo]
MDDLLTWLNTERASPQEVPQQNQDPVETETKGTEGTDIAEQESLHDELLPELDSQERAELLRWIDATQPPSPDVPSSTKTSPFISGLPDFPWASRQQNGEAETEAWISSDLFCTHPSCSRQLPRPLPCMPFLLPRSTSPELPMPAPLDVPAPPSPRTAHLIEEAKRKQPRVVLTRLALPPGCMSCRVPDNHHNDDDGTEPAECPAPACTTSGHQQCTGSFPARKRKLPRGQDAPGQKRRR